MHKFFLLTLLILMVLNLPASSARAERDGSFQSMHTEYMRLRNTDAGILKIKEREALAEELIHYAKEHPHGDEAPYALYDAAILNEELFRGAGERSYAEQAAKLLGDLAARYSAHAVADDALVKRGDILSLFLGDDEGARESYLKVVTDYQDSDMYEVARARLNPKMAGSDSSGVASVDRSKDALNSVLQGGSQYVILLDPGHGGEDRGAIGRGGILEKDVVLDIALRLERLLRERLSAVVRLTRRQDEFVPLMERTNMANDFEADIFISLHTNASPNGGASGLETYYLDNTDDQGSRRLAERENMTVGGGEPQSDLQFILSDLIQNAKQEDSIVLANVLHRNVFKHLREAWPDSKDLGVKRAPFYVLVGAHMPCVLVELFFIDNPKDGARLASAEFRQEIAEGLFKGIESYLKRNMRPQ